MKTLTLFIRRNFSAVESLFRPTKLRLGWSVGGFFAILFAAGLNISQAQDTWTQKADVGLISRGVAVGFSIGKKGYIGTGENYSDNPVFRKDFWEYDPSTNVWTQKADFGGIGRSYAVGFSIGNKGYIGTGANFDQFPIYVSDFWEYDPPTNTWMQRADFAGGARDGAVGFSIGNKGYIGTGTDDSYKNDFWEYDPSTDTWTQKANVGGGVRNNGIGFSSGNYGYIGTGYSGNGSLKKDFWEYDPTANSWNQRADFGGEARRGAVGFSIVGNGYIGTGKIANGNNINDFWEYDRVLNIWTQKTNFGGTARNYAVGFSIDDKGYFGTGGNCCTYENDFWEYTPDTSPCAAPTNLSVTNITSTSAKLKWDAVTGAEGYKVRYKVANTSVWTVKQTYNTSKTINGLLPNTAYKWEVKSICHIGAPNVSSDWSAKQDFTTAAFRIGDEAVQQVSFQIYPNPAQDHATLQFTLLQSSHASIKVYDVSGREITTLFDGNLEQGEHTLQLNTTQFSKGVYMVKMIGDFGMVNEKLIVQ